MKHFVKIAEGLDVQPLLEALDESGELWDQFPVRTDHPMTAHGEVSDILLRFSDPDMEDERVPDEHESVDYPAMEQLPEARKIVFDLMRHVEGRRLGRVVITRLGPGKRILPHVDGGSHAHYYSRFQVPLQSDDRVFFRAGDETLHMLPGEVWCFNNAAEHEVWNGGDKDRIAMIVDIRL